MAHRLLVVVAACLVVGCARPRSIAERFRGVVAAVEEANFAEGDDARWAAPSWNDEEWQRGLLYLVRPGAETFWIRQSITLPKLPEAFTPAVYVSMQASFEVFWDGRQVGRSGIIGPDGSARRAGPMDNFFTIPAELTNEGKHQIAVRVAVARERLDAPWFHGIAIGDYSAMLRSRTVSQVVPLAGVGVYSIIGVYYLVIFFAAGRRRSALVFALLCLFAGLLAFVETWRWTVGYNSDDHGLRMSMVTALTFAVALLLTSFLILDLQLRRRWVWTAACAGILLLIVALPLGDDERCLALFEAATVMSAAAVVAGRHAPLHRLIPAIVAVIVVGVSLVRGGYSFSDSIFFIAFALVILSLLVSLALEMREERRLRQEALMRATRLELELLQKSVQPHFLMNTLTAVMEWLEEDPPAGLAFLEALADELRLFESMSHQRLVPMEQELALCRSHLMIMHCRKRTRFQLDSDSVNQHATIPPAVFHTLIENAISHNRYSESLVTFTLREQRIGGLRRYLFDAPLNGRKPGGPHRDGTGLRYVKARLEESYPGEWMIEGGARGCSWQTIIEVPV